MYCIRKFFINIFETNKYSKLKFYIWSFFLFSSIPSKFHIDQMLSEQYLSIFLHLIFLTQVLTGHGCFGEYLHRIGAEESPRCRKCAAELDTAQHTLEDCPAFDELRAKLKYEIGEDICPAKLVRALLRGKRERAAVVAFCEDVMLDKGKEERRRDKTDPFKVTRRQNRRIR